MRGAERVVLIMLIAAIFAIVMITLVMVLKLKGLDEEAFETAVLVIGRAGGAV